ncbi:hypothetical protein VTL71DRAFT_7582 [Oculimacula yallundae]|uniref:Uncharacterized protein n=1 Tax=Oculimacula yallundae TaxID=86028 RepID=A0ABR4BW75_9HELO
MVIVTLLTAGVGLALDVYAERKSAKDRRRNEGFHRQSPSLDASLIPTEEGQTEQEIDAFKELQSYANFQEALSHKVLDDITLSPSSNYYDPSSQKSYSEATHTQLSPLPGFPSQSKQGALLYPVIIPQHIHKNTNYWPISYSPSLMNCGVDQTTFLAFIESFNESTKLSPNIDVINIDQLPSNNRWREASSDISIIIPAAVRIFKEVARNGSSNEFLTRANERIFQVRGLYAMILISLPDIPSQIININAMAHGQRVDQGSDLSSELEHKAQERSTDFFRRRKIPASLPNRKLQQMSSFISDYSERRPHFRRFDTSIDTRTRPSIQSKSTSNTLQENLSYRQGPVGHFASSITNRKNHEAQNRRKIRIGVEESQGQEIGVLEGNFKSLAGLEAKAVGPELFTSSERNMAKNDVVQVKESRFGMKTGVMYLVIVNDVMDEAKGKANEQPRPILKWSNSGRESQGNVLKRNMYDLQSGGASPPAYSSGSHFVGTEEHIGV